MSIQNAVVDTAFMSGYDWYRGMPIDMNMLVYNGAVCGSHNMLTRPMIGGYVYKADYGGSALGNMLITDTVSLTGNQFVASKIIPNGQFFDLKTALIKSAAVIGGNFIKEKAGIQI